MPIFMNLLLGTLFAFSSFISQANFKIKIVNQNSQRHEEDDKICFRLGYISKDVSKKSNIVHLVGEIFVTASGDQNEMSFNLAEGVLECTNCQTNSKKKPLNSIDPTKKNPWSEDKNMAPVIVASAQCQKQGNFLFGEELKEWQKAQNEKGISVYALDKDYEQLIIDNKRPPQMEEKNEGIVITNPSKIFPLFARLGHQDIFESGYVSKNNTYFDGDYVTIPPGKTVTITSAGVWKDVSEENKQKAPIQKKLEKTDKVPKVFVTYTPESYLRGESTQSSYLTSNFFIASLITQRSYPNDQKIIPKRLQGIMDNLKKCNGKLQIDYDNEDEIKVKNIGNDTLYLKSSSKTGEIYTLVAQEDLIIKKNEGMSEDFSCSLNKDMSAATSDNFKIVTFNGKNLGPVWSTDDNFCILSNPSNQQLEVNIAGTKEKMVVAANSQLVISREELLKKSINPSKLEWSIVLPRKNIIAVMGTITLEDAQLQRWKIIEKHNANSSIKKSSSSDLSSDSEEDLASKSERVLYMSSLRDVYSGQQLFRRGLDNDDKSPPSHRIYIDDHLEDKFPTFNLTNTSKKMPIYAAVYLCEEEKPSLGLLNQCRRLISPISIDPGKVGEISGIKFDHRAVLWQGNPNTPFKLKLITSPYESDLKEVRPHDISGARGFIRDTPFDRNAAFELLSEHENFKGGKGMLYINEKFPLGIELSKSTSYSSPSNSWSSWLLHSSSVVSLLKSAFGDAMPALDAIGATHNYVKDNPHRLEMVEVKIDRKDQKTFYSPQEEKAVNQRKIKNQKTLSHLCPEKKALPKVDLVLSGGGVRAQLTSTIFKEQLAKEEVGANTSENIFLLDAFTHQVGLSGSTWGMMKELQALRDNKKLSSTKSLYEDVRSNQKKQIVRNNPQNKSDVALSFPEIYDFAAWSRILSPMVAKWFNRQPLTLADLYSALLHNKILGMSNKTSEDYLTLEDMPVLESASHIPIPLFTAIDRRGNRWYEINSEQMRSLDYPEIYTTIPLYGMGRDYNYGVSTSNTPAPAIQDLMATFGSAYSVKIGDIKELVLGMSSDKTFKGYFSGQLFEQIGKMMEQILVDAYVGKMKLFCDVLVNVTLPISHNMASEGIGVCLAAAGGVSEEVRRLNEAINQLSSAGIDRAAVINNLDKMKGLCTYVGDSKTLPEALAKIKEKFEEELSHIGAEQDAASKNRKEELEKYLKILNNADGEGDSLVLGKLLKALDANYNIVDQVLEIVGSDTALAVAASGQNLLAEIHPNVQIVVPVKEGYEQKEQAILSGKVIPNPINGLKDQRLGEDVNEPFLDLSDAGKSFNLPFPPVLQPGRRSDVIVAFDASADADDHPGDALIGAEKYAKEHGLLFPEVTEGQIRDFKDGVDTALTLKGSPTVVYIPLRANKEINRELQKKYPDIIKDPETFRPVDVAGTFQFNYKSDHYKLLLDYVEEITKRSTASIRTAIQESCARMNDHLVPL